MTFFFLLLVTVNFCPVGTCLSTRRTGNLNFETISATALHVKACNRNRAMAMRSHVLNKILSWLQCRGVWRMVWGSLNIVKDKKPFLLQDIGVSTLRNMDSLIKLEYADSWQLS